MKPKVKLLFVKYRYYWLLFISAILATIFFGIYHEWFAMVWAILASLYACLALKEVEAKNAIIKQFEEYVKRTKAGESNEAKT